MAAYRVDRGYSVPRVTEPSSTYRSWNRPATPEEVAEHITKLTLAGLGLGEPYRDPGGAL